MLRQETIAAIATAPGRGGVGVIRVSGVHAASICHTITGKTIAAGEYAFTTFRDPAGELIDRGIALFFRAPHSYTGEDVVEFQTHGSDVILQLLLETIYSLGARPARAGEFTERAFLNDKLDLVQAEAVMDLIDSKSRNAARSAMRSLEGVFSNQLEAIQHHVFQARALLEASLDFPDEEDIHIDMAPVQAHIEQALTLCSNLLDNAEAGATLSKGIHVVIAGKPNVGKSSLLNRLAGNDIAIVSDIPGTTRDMVKQSILLDGVEMMLVDTAGVRESEDQIEKQGISRSLQSLKTADLVLYVYDQENDPAFLNEQIPDGVKTVFVRNKIDIVAPPPEQLVSNVVAVSVKTGEGIEDLLQHIAGLLRLNEQDENTVLARRRHIEALRSATEYLYEAQAGLGKQTGAELVGEQLRLAQRCFDEVLGRVTADDILGAVFSEFCIGK